MSHNATPQHSELLTIGDLLQRWKINRSSVTRLRQRDANFPAPIYIGLGSPRFVPDEIRAYEESRRARKAGA